MTPPPTDPIRPLGPVADGIFVGRAEHPWRVRRRTRHEEEARERGDRRGDGTGEDRPALGPAVSSLQDPAAEAGVYDDHGRSHHREDYEGQDRPHVDATA